VRGGLQLAAGAFTCQTLRVLKNSFELLGLFADDRFEIRESVMSRFAIRPVP